MKFYKRFFCCFMVIATILVLVSAGAVTPLKNNIDQNINNHILNRELNFEINENTPQNEIDDTILSIKSIEHITSVYNVPAELDVSETSGVLFSAYTLSYVHEGYNLKITSGRAFKENEENVAVVPEVLKDFNSESQRINKIDGKTLVGKNLVFADESGKEHKLKIVGVYNTSDPIFTGNQILIPRNSLIKFNNEVIFYGENEDNDYIIKNIKLASDGSSFDLYEKDKFISNFFVPLYGHHMVMNTVASIIVALRNGLTKEEVKKLLENFKNAARRFAIEKVKDTIIVDDYAHHPTEVKVTLQAIRQKYPDKKLTVVFRPNTYSRTSAFKNEFASALSEADKVYLTPIKCDRERKEDYPPISSEDIIKLIPNSELVDEESISKVLKDKDGVVAFMGCATVAHLIENFKELL